MPSRQPVTVRRLELTLKKPLLSVYGWLKPTVVIGGRGHPGQWGTGTWQIPADEVAIIRIYIFNRLWKFAHAEYRLTAEQPAVLEYTPHALWRGSIRPPRH